MLSKIAIRSQVMVKAYARPMVFGSINRCQFATDNTDVVKTDAGL